MKHQHVSATLTHTEAAAVFAMSAIDDEPLPPVTRALVFWAGDAWMEIDPATGATLAHGLSEPETRHGL